MDIAIYAERPDFKRGAIRGPSAAKPNAKKDRKFLFWGENGKPGNFMLLCGVAGEDTGYHPRHRHDFDQFRFAVKGDLDFGPGAVIPEGCLAYFPAGTPYGPYEGGVYLDPEIISAQFEGAYRANYYSFGSDEVRAAVEEMSKTGEFKDGYYQWFDDKGGKHNQDGLEAAMDYVRGHKTVYPTPRYAETIVIDPREFEWIETAPGLFVKELGRFTERETRLAMIKVKSTTPVRVSTLGQITLHVAFSGTGTAGGKTLQRRDGIRLEPDETVEITSPEGIEFMVLGLPKLNYAAAAAE